MKYFILDTNIIINYSEVLSYSKKDTKLIVPDVVLKEIFQFQSPRRKELVNLINSAQEKGLVVISNMALPQKKLKGPITIGFTDFSIVGYARFLQESGNTEVFVVTDDRTMNLFAKSNGIATFNSSDLLTFFSTVSSKNETISNEAKKIDKIERWSYFTNFILGIVITFLFVILIRNFGDLIDKYSNILWIIGLIILGICLFEVRQKRRQLYGMLEVLFAITTFIIVFYPKIILSNWDPYIKIIAGLYVMVRGLDNIYIGSEKKRLGSIIKKLLKF